MLNYRLGTVNENHSNTGPLGDNEQCSSKMRVLRYGYYWISDIVNM